MGRPKQLLLVRGKAAVRYCAETFISAGVSDIVVVVAKGGPVGAAVQDLPVRVVCNEDPASDMAASVRVGLKAVSPDARFVLVGLADHPLVSSETVRTVLAESAKDPVKIVIPRYQGRRGHPTLFPRSIIEEIGEGHTLRDLISIHAGHVRYLDVDDEGVVLDMDTEEDYQKMVQKTEER